MGMFDYVKCEVPLPDGYYGEWFQTKDFDDPYLGTYVIRKDGRLVHLKSELEIDMNFHGILNFYDIHSGVWYEYNAKFTDGNLDQIEKLVEAEEP
jgi:hypothetical protein